MVDLPLSYLWCSTWGYEYRFSFGGDSDSATNHRDGALKKHVCQHTEYKEDLNIYIYVYIYICICMYVCIYICKCICICICILYIYIVPYQSSGKKQFHVTWAPVPQMTWHFMYFGPTNNKQFEKKEATMSFRQKYGKRGRFGIFIINRNIRTNISCYTAMGKN